MDCEMIQLIAWDWDLDIENHTRSVLDTKDGLLLS